jgi:hypothetical protein
MVGSRGKTRNEHLPVKPASKDAREIVAEIIDRPCKSGYDQWKLLIELAAHATHAAATVLDHNQPEHEVCPLCRTIGAVSERVHSLAGMELEEMGRSDNEGRHVH